MEMPPLDHESREILRDAREGLAEVGVELTFAKLELICHLGMMLSQVVSRPLSIEMWDGKGLQFDAEASRVDYLEFWDEDEESVWELQMEEEL